MSIPSQRRSPGDPESPSLTALLSSDHQEIDRLFIIAMRSLDSGPTVDACTALDRIWMRLAVHIRAEHKVVFPVLRDTHLDLRLSLDTLHEGGDFFMATLAGAVRAKHDPSPDFASVSRAVGALKLRLAAHNALEEDAIYPVADCLPQGQLASVLGGVARELAILPARYGS